ncbi:MAG: aminotransferase class IV [Nannocystaceae bacterium]|nr:aminotransferase class IV [Nannocystaceae bacterium]
MRPIEECRLSILDRGLLFGESIYEVLPVVAGRVLFVEQHGDRMRTGAAALSLAHAVPSDAALSSLGLGLLAAESLDEGTLYLQVTGGAGPRAMVPALGPSAAEFFAFVQPLTLPRHAVTATVATARDPRWVRCELKTTMLLPAVLARRSAGPVDEVVFFDDDGLLTEGGSSCVFIVEDGRVVMPPLSPRILPSVTRGLLGMEAAEVSITVETSPVSRVRLLAADEVGLASTTKLVMPVATLDGQTVASSRDGMCTRLAALLRARYGLED